MLALKHAVFMVLSAFNGMSEKEEHGTQCCILPVSWLKQSSDPSRCLYARKENFLFANILKTTITDEMCSRTIMYVVISHVFQAVIKPDNTD